MPLENKPIPREDILKLEPGQKYTFWAYDEFGFPFSVHAVLHSVEVKPYAQYKETIYLEFLPKRKRRLRELQIKPYQDLLVWEGYREVDSEMYVSSEDRGNGVITRRSLRCFDREYTRRALASIELKPVFKF